MNEWSHVEMLMVGDVQIIAFVFSAWELLVGNSILFTVKNWQIFGTF